MSPATVGRALLVPLLASFMALVGPSAGAGPGYHEPEVGECHDYGVRGAQATSEPREPVSCDEKHTALTVAVERVPRRIGLGNPGRAFESVGKRCYKALFATLGGTTTQRAMTAYALTFFLPTKAERARGARWIRCDLVLYGGTKLQALPDTLLPDPLDDSVERCLLVRPSGHLLTVCSRRHNYRVADIIELGGSYRSPQKFRNIALQRCDKLAGKNFYYSYPSRVAWEAGDKRITCSKRTSR